MNDFKSSPFPLSTRLCLVGMAGWFVFVFSHMGKPPPIPILILAAIILTVQYAKDYVLSYRVTPDRIVIRRPLRDISLLRSGLQTATLDPRVFDDKSWSFNNRSGLGHCGRFSSRRLGAFRSFVSNKQNSVVLRFQDQTLVVSPEDPRAFLAALNVPRDETVGPATTSAPVTEGYLHGYF